MAIITTGNSFNATDAVTSTKLNNIANAATFVAGAVDGTSLELKSDGKLGVKDDGITLSKVNANAIGTSQLVDNAVTTGKILNNAVTTDKILNEAVTTAKIDDSAVTTAKIDDSAVTTAKLATSSSKSTGVTFAKMQHISTDKILGRTSSGDGDVQEINFLDQDDMSSNSATSVATQQSIKAYVDEYAMKYSGSTGTISTTNSWADWDLSSFVGSNRALVIIELYDASNVNQLLLKTKGSQVSGGYIFSNVSGWGSSGICLSTTDQGGTVQVITDENGFVEVQGYAAGTGINYTIQAYQKLA